VMEWILSVLLDLYSSTKLDINSKDADNYQFRDDPGVRNWVYYTLYILSPTIHNSKKKGKWIWKENGCTENN
jgi:hypothetical protein